MEVSVKQRLTKFIQSEGLSVKSFEKKCSLSNRQPHRLHVEIQLPQGAPLLLPPRHLRRAHRPRPLRRLSPPPGAFQRAPAPHRRRALPPPLRRSAGAPRARARPIYILRLGLAYSDSQLVEFFDIVERSGARFIDATRRKTGTRFLTPLLAPAEAILCRYGGRLPLISNQRANAYLHEVERRLNLCKPLTTHVARHTFATTVALAHGVPVESLSRMLGHRDIKTTQIYAKVLAQTVADDGAALAAKIR